MDISTLSSAEKMAIVCLYYAMLPSEHSDYKEKHTKHVTIMAQKYGVKYGTLKNNKDAFDAVFSDINGRRGWRDRPLEKRNKLLYQIFQEYGQLPREEIKTLVDKIIIEAGENENMFFSIKTKDADTVKAIIGGVTAVTFDGLNVLREQLEIGQSIFIVFGGDNPPWETGLAGFGKIDKAPYDIGYDSAKPSNYKIDVDISFLLPQPIKREHLLRYPETYNIKGIGPITSWEQNQAISLIGESKAVSLFQAVIEIFPNIRVQVLEFVPKTLIDRINGPIRRFIVVEGTLGVPTPDIEGAEDFYLNDQSTDDYSDTFTPNIEEVLEDFYLDSRPIQSIQNFINARKHIILTGPPGTGKTTIAQRIADQAISCNYIEGSIMTTATADWTTFDTIGGYMPNPDGELLFSEGIFLRSIRENAWLIIDEINRAEIDKAFGPLFTVLAGNSVKLPFVTKQNGLTNNISIMPTNKLRSYYDPDSSTYFIGKNWRILATMNTYDKNSLFTMSFAFMRRFSLVNIPVPSFEQFSSLVEGKISREQPSIKRTILALIKISPKAIGAAIIIDILEYLSVSKYENFIEGVASIFLPQLEGISYKQVIKLYSEFGVFLDLEDQQIFKATLCELFDIDSSKLSIDSHSEGVFLEEDGDTL